MKFDLDPSQIPVTALARGCAEQTARFHNNDAYDPSACFELFRRAFCERDERAWDCIYAQYAPQVKRWVTRHSAFAATGEEPEYFCNRALEKLWSAIGPAFPFTRLAQILRYLQMCVHSVIMDHVRAAEHATVSAQQPLEGFIGDRTASVESQVLAMDAAAALWDTINSLLVDEQERTVIHASFVLGLKPREICAAHPACFTDVRAVYRIKENVLARLRRNRELKVWRRDA